MAIAAGALKERGDWSTWRSKGSDWPASQPTSTKHHSWRQHVAASHTIRTFFFLPPSFGISDVFTTNVTALHFVGHSADDVYSDASDGDDDAPVSSQMLQDSRIRLLLL